MKTYIKNLFILPALLIGFGFTAATTDCLHAATFNVTTANISGPGSLPVAIAQANATPGKNRINISVTSITLGLQLPTITNSVAITGTASAPSIISGGGTLPLFTFATGTTNSLSNLALANCYTTNSGAAISNASTLSVSSCVITNDIAANSLFGGAIINSGVMIISSSVISGNQAGIGASFYNSVGGAIYNSGTMILNNSTLSGNQAGNAGAIFNAGALTVNGLIVSNNFADAGFGGGIYNTGSLTISKSAFIGNAAVGANGQNSRAGGGGGGAGFGGALFSSSGNVGITNSTFFLNTANGGGHGLSGNYNNNNGGNGGGSAGGSGGIGTSGSPGGFGSGGGGGGSLFAFVGGSGGFGGGAGGANGISGDPGDGIGAAIFIQTGTTFIVNCTIVSNLCWQGPCYAGGICNYGASVTLLNTIAAGNSATTSSPDLMGTYISSGSNLIGNNQGATNLSIFDFQNVSANLGTLQNNGGSTLTCAPLAGSFAIGYGTSAGAPKTDQRGVPRPQNGAYDIGAVQVVTGSPFVNGAAMVKGSGFSLNTIFDTTNSYRIQASTNLTTWIDISTNASGGGIQFTDSAARNLNRRFYRTATP